MGVLATCFVLQATGAAFPEPTLPEPVYKVATNEPESAFGVHTDLQDEDLTSTGPAACAACVAACHGDCHGSCWVACLVPAITTLTVSEELTDEVATNEPESALGVHTDLQDEDLTSTGPAACAACLAACHGNCHAACWLPCLVPALTV